MSPNRRSVWKVMAIRISQELPLFNFESLDILCPRIEHLCKKLWPFEFLDSFRCSISRSRYIMSQNRISVWNVMTIQISRKLRFSISIISIHYVPKSKIRVKSYDHLNLSRASVVQFRASRYIMSPNQTSEWNVMTIWISQELLLFNFERFDILCPQIGIPCKKLWPFRFL